MYMTTNTQNKLQILQDNPLLTSDPVLSKIPMVRDCEKIIYHLLHQLDKKIMIEARKIYWSHFAKLTEHKVHGIPSSVHITQELLIWDDRRYLL